MSPESGEGCHFISVSFISRILNDFFVGIVLQDMRDLWFLYEIAFLCELRRELSKPARGHMIIWTENDVREQNPARLEKSKFIS